MPLFGNATRTLDVSKCSPGHAAPQPAAGRPPRAAAAPSPARVCQCRAPGRARAGAAPMRLTDSLRGPFDAFPAPPRQPSSEPPASPRFHPSTPGPRAGAFVAPASRPGAAPRPHAAQAERLSQRRPSTRGGHTLLLLTPPPRKWRFIRIPTLLGPPPPIPAHTTLSPATPPSPLRHAAGTPLGAVFVGTATAHELPTGTTRALTPRATPGNMFRAQVTQPSE
jgi:hypothetical protein